MKNLELFFLFLIFRFQLTHQWTNCAYVVGQSNATDSFDENQKNSLDIGRSDEISKSHS